MQTTWERQTTHLSKLFCHKPHTCPKSVGKKNHTFIRIIKPFCSGKPRIYPNHSVQTNDACIPTILERQAALLSQPFGRGKPNFQTYPNHSVGTNQVFIQSALERQTTHVSQPSWRDKPHICPNHFAETSQTYPTILQRQTTHLSKPS